MCGAKVFQRSPAILFKQPRAKLRPCPPKVRYRYLSTNSYDEKLHVMGGAWDALTSGQLSFERVSDLNGPAGWE
jgi:hypothetical protein